MGGHGWRTYGRRHVLGRPVASRPARFELAHRRPVSTYNVLGRQCAPQRAQAPPTARRRALGPHLLGVRISQFGTHLRHRRLRTFAVQKCCSRRCGLGLVLPTLYPKGRVPLMNHTDTSCDCGTTVSALALRWRCPVCGKTAIMKVSTLAAVCDGDTIRKVEPDVVSHQITPRS
jgi:hypothetical protein